VVFISQSTGSPQTANIAQPLVDSNLLAIALTFYSGWPDPEFGQNVLETYTNYCFESMNGMQFIADEGGETVAIVSFPGEFGQDGATGAKLGAEEVGLEIVYDGEGAIIPPTPTNPNPDNSGVVQAIVDADPDWVWVTSTPGILAQLIGQATADGFDGKWSGNGPTYADDLMSSDLADVLDESYWASAYTVAYGTDVPGMQEMIDAISETNPDGSASDFYVYGWTEAQITEAILRQAAENGDLTREGVERAGFEVEVDFQGLAPPQSWAGEPNDYVVRESYIFKPRSDLYSSESITEGGATGMELVEGPFASELAQNYEYEGACFAPQG
jgi:ABC-type branched-subunit amino acid transport system substrate-binding protein